MRLGMFLFHQQTNLIVQRVAKLWEGAAVSPSAANAELLRLEICPSHPLPSQQEQQSPKPTVPM